VATGAAVGRDHDDHAGDDEHDADQQADQRQPGGEQVDLADVVAGQLGLAALAVPR
jgi:hypothetical protein